MPRSRSRSAQKHKSASKEDKPTGDEHRKSSKKQKDGRHDDHREDRYRYPSPQHSKYTPKDKRRSRSRTRSPYRSAKAILPTTRRSRPRSHSRSPRRHQEKPRSYHAPTMTNEHKFDMSTVYDLTKDIQPGWNTTNDFLDATIEKGLPLLKLVKESEFSIKTGIAGKDIRTIRLIDILYEGPKNGYLRQISAGRFLSIIFSKSIKENQFITRLQRGLRPDWVNGKPSTDFDLDVIASAHAASLSKPFTTPLEKKTIYEDLADKCFNFLVTLGPESDEKKIQARLRQLEEENAKLKISSTPAKEPPKTPKTNIRNFFTPPAKQGDNHVQDLNDPASDDDLEDVVKALKRHQSVKKVLKAHPPKGTKLKDIDALIKLMDLPAKQKKAIDEATEIHFKSFRALAIVKRTGLKEIATDWGLPVDMVSKMDDKTIIKACVLAQDIC